MQAGVAPQGAGWPDVALAIADLAHWHFPFQNHLVTTIIKGFARLGYPKTW
jgi:hypothetical protein